MKKTAFFALAVAMSALHAAAASADLSDPCGCNAGLVPEVIRESYDQQIDLAFLRQIDEKQYEQIKRNAETNGKYYEMAQGTGNFSEFREKINNYLETIGYRLNVASAQSFLLTRIQTPEWGACKRACIEKQQGFLCDVSKVTPSLVAASCSWRVEGVNPPRKVSIVANGTTRPAEEIPPNTTRDWQFPRDPKATSLLTFTLDNGSSQTITVAPVPEIIQISEAKPVEVGYCVGRGGVEGVHLWGPTSEICSGISEWGRYTGRLEQTARLTDICSCVGAGGVNGVALWGPKGEICAGIPTWGTYKDNCRPALDLSWCACFGHGDILERQVLWGPKAADVWCGGIQVWGRYDKFCQNPR